MSDTEIRDAILRRIEEYIADIELVGELTEDEKTIFESVKNIVNNEFEKASYKKEKGKDTFKLEFELPMEFKKDFEEDELMGQNRMYDCFARIGADIRADMKWADMKFSAGKSRPSVSELSISPYYAEISDVLKESFADAVVMEEEGKLKVSIELPSGYKKDFEKSTEGNSNVTHFLAMAVSEIDGGHMDITGRYEKEICVALRDAFLKVLPEPDKEKKIGRE